MKHKIFLYALAAVASVSFLHASDRRSGSGSIPPSLVSADAAGGRPPLPRTVGPCHDSRSVASAAARRTPPLEASPPHRLPNLGSRTGRRIGTTATSATNFEAPDTIDVQAKLLTDDRNLTAQVGGEFFWNTKAVSEIVVPDPPGAPDIKLTTLFENAAQSADLDQQYLRWLHYDVEDNSGEAPLRQSMWYLVTADRLLEIDQHDIVQPIVVPTADGVPYYMELSKKNAAQHAAFLLKMKHAQSKEEKRVQLRLQRGRPRVEGRRAFILRGSPQGVALWQWLAMVSPFSAFRQVDVFAAEDKELVSTFFIRFFYNLKQVFINSSSIIHFDLSDFAFSQSCLEDINAGNNPFVSIGREVDGLCFPRLRTLRLPEGCKAAHTSFLKHMPALEMLAIGGRIYDAKAIKELRKQEKEKKKAEPVPSNSTIRSFLTLAIPAAFVLTVGWADKKGYLSRDSLKRVSHWFS